MEPLIINKLKLGNSLLHEGNISRAQKEFHDVLLLDPANEFALNLLGLSYIKDSAPEEAVKYLVKALKVNDRDPETHNNLGLAYKDLKQMQQAKDCFEGSLKLDGRQPVTLNNLGNIYSAIEEHRLAAQHFEAALKIDPNYAEALCNFAQALKELSVLEVAVQVIERACQLEPSNSQYLNVKGEILLAKAKYDEASSIFQKAILLDNNLVARVNLSTALKHLSKYEEAVKQLNAVLELEPNNTEAHNHLGVLYEQLGQFDEAAESFRNALSFTPNHASSYYQLAKLKNHNLTEQEVAKVQSILTEENTPSVFRASLHFALASYLDKQHSYELAILEYIQGQEIKSKKSPYNKYISEAYNHEMKRLMPLTSYISEDNNEDLFPVFIVGMPRSGTSLTEQILSSHSAVFGAGELSYISDLVNKAEQLTQNKYPHCLKLLTLEHLKELGADYKRRVINTFGQHKVVIDKNPLNFNFVGFIKAILPNAKFIYCKRNAADNCISIFKLPFDDNQSYAHDLKALGHYYHSHSELMRLWKELFEEDIHLIQYEDMVNDQIGQSKALTKYLNLEYEPELEEFYQTKRIVMTPSAEQVRQPIYKSSINSWQKYGDSLGPLINELKRYDEL